MANAVPTAGEYPKKHSKREAKVIETAIAASTAAQEAAEAAQAAAEAAQEAAEEAADSFGVATVIAAISATSNLVAPGALEDAAPLAGTETRLDGLESKVNALIAALKVAGLMAEA
jgi:hypothetical protein